MLSVNSISLKAGSFAIRNLSFEVRKGEYFFILGRSGSGKSMTLEAIAGLRKIHEGTIVLHEREITRLALNQRKVGLVFQSLALFPHLSVAQNIAFPLRQMKMTTSMMDRTTREMAERLAISDLLNRRPGSLSGGEHQRVALARTLVMKPNILLLDEPLSSVDILLKEELIEVLKDIHQTGQTILHVTHDYYEVKALADRIAIMENGQIMQTGTRDEIIQNPRCRLAEKLN